MYFFRAHALPPIAKYVRELTRDCRRTSQFFSIARMSALKNEFDSLLHIAPMFEPNEESLWEAVQNYLTRAPFFKVVIRTHYSVDSPSERCRPGTPDDNWRRVISSPCARKSTVDIVGDEVPSWIAHITYVFPRHFNDLLYWLEQHGTPEVTYADQLFGGEYLVETTFTPSRRTIPPAPIGYIPFARK